MKLRLLEYLRCPECRSVFQLSNPIVQLNHALRPVPLPQCLGVCPFSIVTGEPRDCRACQTRVVVQGVLACQGCGQRYPVEDGIPRFCARLPGARDTTSSTAESFGYLWARSVIGHETYDTRSYHFSRMEARLRLPSPRGLVLDAGCGDGIDLANQAGRPDVEIVGVDISGGGSQTSYRRTVDLPNAHVVQADVCRLPFGDGVFDLAYSYGVLHHLESPTAGLAEMVRVARAAGHVVVYLYEDFTERRFFWRWLLRLVSLSRRMTTRLPHHVLFRGCQGAAPFVFLFFTVPSRIAARIPVLASFGASVPFRHGTGPFSLAGDLYDRFSAPVEGRYGRQSALELFRSAGLERLAIVFERGWMVSGVKPPVVAEASGD